MQDSMPRLADVLIDREHSAQLFGRERRAALWDRVAIEVPGRIDERVHRVASPSYAARLGD